MSKPGTLRCPICKRAAADRETNSTFPFCSARCRLVDLSRWLDEDYRIPIEVTERRLPPDTGEDRQ